jgi:hypothetical protein
MCVTYSGQIRYATLSMHDSREQEEAPAVAAAEADANPTDDERALPCPR